jgi:hypothetical protein
MHYCCRTWCYIQMLIVFYAPYYIQTKHIRRYLFLVQTAQPRDSDLVLMNTCFHVETPDHPTGSPLTLILYHHVPNPLLSIHQLKSAYALNPKP